MHDTISGPHGPANPLRLYAEQTWAKPGVADLLLHLQDTHGLNVNLLLLLLWLGRQHVAITPVQMQALQRSVTALDMEILRPLRQVRRDIRSRQLPEPLHEQARQLELALEYHMIGMLYSQACEFSPSDATFPALANLSLYVSATAPAAEPCLEQLLSLSGPHI